MKVSRLLQSRARWFQDTISFSCTACGKCCKGRTNVYINNAEITEIREHLGIHTDTEFRAQYMRGDNSLKNDPTDQHCVFLKDNKCSVYEVRPSQCRTYPFWPQHILGRAEWEAEAVRCEGMSVLKPSFKLSKENSASPAVSSDNVLTNMALYMVHDRGRGPDWTYETALDLLRESELSASEQQQQLQEDSQGLVSGLEEELFTKYHSNIVYEDDFIRVVDSTETETDGAFAGSDMGNSVGTGSDSACMDDVNAGEPGGVTPPAVSVSVRRRLEFKESPQYSQSEIQLAPVVGHYGVYQGQRFQQYRADHSRLLFSAHRVIAGECKSFLSSRSDHGPDGDGDGLPRAVEVVVLGAGGCALPCHLIDALGSVPPCARVVVDAVDTESVVLLAARAHFGAGEYEDNGDLALHVGDGLAFLDNRSMMTANQGNLKQGEDGSVGYDIIVLDVCCIDESGVISTSGEEGTGELHLALKQWSRAIARAGCRGGGVYINAWGTGWIEEAVRVFDASGLFTAVRVTEVAISEGGHRNAVLATSIK